MTARAVPEWQGKTPESMPGKLVLLRQGFAKAPAQRRASRPIEPAFEGDIRGVRSDFSPAIFTPKE